MDNLIQKQIFHAQVANVRALEGAMKHVRRSINLAMRRADDSTERSHTLVLAVLYCAWLEAFFSKLVHTPFGLTSDEIEQVKAQQSKDGIARAWDKCVQLALRRVPDRGRSNYLPNIEQQLQTLIDDFVQKPAILRNKVAHGQWVMALNRHNSAVNVETTKELADLNVVTVDRWKLAVSRLAAVIEALIESPGRAFHRDYGTEMARMKEDLKASQSWTRESRMDRLARKPIRPTVATGCPHA